MNSSFFSTPILSPILRGVAILGLKLSGWKVIPLTPMPSPPGILIAAPHTSNWDFMLMIAAALYLQIDLRWMGKHTLFRQPFTGLMRWMGGIPVDRNSANNVVSQTVEKFQQHPELVVIIPPEGTRKKVSEWKTGFYHIACKAGLPVVMTCLDGENKELRFLGVFHPSGNIDADMPLIRKHYENIVGVNPDNS